MRRDESSCDDDNDDDDANGFYDASETDASNAETTNDSHHRHQPQLANDLTAAATSRRKQSSKEMSLSEDILVEAAVDTPTANVQDPQNIAKDAASEDNVNETDPAAFEIIAGAVETDGGHAVASGDVGGDNAAADDVEGGNAAAEVDGDTWESLFGEDGDSLDESQMNELISAVGNVAVQKPQFDYTEYVPKVRNVPRLS